jgi:5-aminopentanamidase
MRPIAASAKPRGSSPWTVAPGSWIIAAMDAPALKIALLHLSPTPGAVRANQFLIELGLTAAADAGADWIVTPELATTGYGFAASIGAQWIEKQPDAWVRSVAAFAKDRRVAVFLSVPERRWNRLFNSVIAIDRGGRVAGKHCKINTLRVGSEAWSSPGRWVRPVRLDDFGAVGVLICADACSPEIAQKLAAKGVRAFVSSAAWAPGLHGPSGEWEEISRATQCPVFVCNRTGCEPVLDFTDGESVVAFGGERLVSVASETSAVFLIEWDFGRQSLGGVARLSIPAVPAPELAGGSPDPCLGATPRIPRRP